VIETEASEMEDVLYPRSADADRRVALEVNL